jgi:hypothetical protein
MMRCVSTLAILLAGCSSGNLKTPTGGGAHDMSVAAPTALGPAISTTACLAVDATRAYFSAYANAQAQILSVPIAGGDPSVVASGGDKYACVTIDSNGVYYFDNGSVMKAPLVGGAATALATGQHLAQGSPNLIASGGYLYWLTDSYGSLDMFSGKNAIVRVSTKGGSVEVISADIGINTGGLAIDGTNIYYSDNSGVIARPLSNPTTTTTIIRPTISPSVFAVGANYVAVAEANGIGMGDVAVFRPDGQGRVVVSSSLVKPLAVDDKGVYVEDSNSLERLALDGSGATQLAARPARAVAFTSDRILFTDGATLWAVAK